MQIEPIAILQSPFKQKFAIPRQANLVKAARGRLIFNAGYSDENLLRSIEDFSHLWLIFVFHASAEQGWTATVQPPRLGGKERVGVFASRSPFRPNPIGMSVVENLGVTREQGKLTLTVGGLDLLDGTPILDIKPYLPYADSIPTARAGYAQTEPAQKFSVDFASEAEASLELNAARYPDLRALIVGVLSQDPRPAWRVKPGDDKQYGITLYDLNIKWKIEDDNIIVLTITTLA